MYQIVFYVPASHLEPVKQALFEQGAGKIGAYDQCAWQTLGQGQFRPLAGSNAFIGEQGQVERLEEYKVELVCEAQYLKAAVHALLEAHPYEEPAYNITQLINSM